MNSVKINRDELLKIVTENRSKHIADYEESVTDYKAAAIKLAESNLELVKTGDLKEIVKFKSLPAAPVSHEKEYNRAIRMLELSVETVIEIEEDVFNQLVLDEWGWKNAFVAASTMYKSLV